MNKLLQKFIKDKENPKFAPFPDPNGVPYEEFLEKHPDYKSAFPDPNGVPYDEFVKTHPDYVSPFPDPNGVEVSEFEK